MKKFSFLSSYDPLNFILGITAFFSFMVSFPQPPYLLIVFTQSLRSGLCLFSFSVVPGHEQ
jgi:hypothetical protein